MVPLAYVAETVSSFIFRINGDALKSTLFPSASVTFNLTSVEASWSATTFSASIFIVEFILPLLK